MLPFGFVAALASVGCEMSLPVAPSSDAVDLGTREDDIYWCCDPDRIPCECPGLWHCTEGASGKRCSQQSPPMPDEGGAGPWACQYSGDEIVCRGDAADHPDAGGDDDWQCAEQGDDVICRRPREGDDWPDDGADGAWDCNYSADGEMRTCDDEDEGGEGEGEGGEGEGEGGEGEGEGPDEVGQGGEVCDGLDNDRDGRIDEGRVCGDASEGGGEDCPVGAIRICDAYCGVHQTCGPDGNWGPCTVDEMCEGVSECDQHSDCPRGLFCDYGMCAPGTFTWGPCESDFDCEDPFGMAGGQFTCQRDQGVCIIDCYHHSDCGAGLVCDLGQCVEDPYVPGQC